ncbi:MAG: hypothetical protein L0J23_04705, partial [Bifidobacterium crudilactis]|nr:hypothetical protein [Bifidobacterium crudilactis]
ATGVCAGLEPSSSNRPVQTVLFRPCNVPHVICTGASPFLIVADCRAVARIADTVSVLSLVCVASLRHLV